jgi:hypothetical protein
MNRRSEFVHRYLTEKVDFACRIRESNGDSAISEVLMTVTYEPLGIPWCYAGDC